MALWLELLLRFDDAVSRAEWPLVDRFLKLAAWCVSEDSGVLPNDSSTAAVVAFYEHLPQDRAHWQYFSRWFSHAEFESFLPVFAYHLSRDELEELKEAYGAGAK